MITSINMLGMQRWAKSSYLDIKSKSNHLTKGDLKSKSLNIR